MRIAKAGGRSGCAWRQTWCVLLFFAGLIALGAPGAEAGGPRFVAGQGPGWNVPAWVTVAWFRDTVRYSTDPGRLSANVSHAEADAMVAAAAAVWNVPTSSVALVQGGELAEDVSANNSFFNGTEVVFPADVRVSNEAAVPLAIAYDADGGLIDLLLGPGASEPDSCQENAVVGDVDDVHQSNGEIAHATLILNGRCVGSAPEQMTQMRYQLARAFGRVLGLSWSQTNDNVFTAQNPVTANQLAFWPLMHPIDVICGNYTYQCMTNPFTLRADDLNTLAQLYPVYQGAVPAGKQGSSNDALYLRGFLTFPTGQGMAWANITSRRNHQGAVESWQTTSTMTGFEFQQASRTPLTDTPAIDSGMANAGLEAYFVFRRVPLDQVSDVVFTMEPINPLYMGEAAVGPYLRMPVAPSGSPTLLTTNSVLSNGDSPVNFFLTPAGAAASCSPGADGTEAAPVTGDPSGWQAGQFCSWGHTSWWSVPVAAGHTWSMEVTATDEDGLATMSKAMPVIGAWQANDAAGTAPTVAAQGVAFNSMALGMTQMAMDAPVSDTVYRIALSDQFGAGRPDFTYTARVLYADHVSPDVVGGAGGQITITGTGFRDGNQVQVNGYPATVVSASATAMVAIVPPMAMVGAAVGVPVDVTVSDPETAGSAGIAGALRYAVLPNVMQSISVPARLESDVTAGTPFAVRLLASDGLTPVSGAMVTLTASAGTAALAICGGQASCTVPTGSDGVIATAVNGTGVGTAVLTATETPGGAHVEVSLGVTEPVRAVAIDRAAHYVAAGAADTWTLRFTAEQDGEGVGNVPVQWTVAPALSALGADSLTGAGGVASAVVAAPTLPSGAVETVTACAWATMCASSTIYAVDAAEWTLAALPNAAQGVPASASLTPFAVRVQDAVGHPLEQAPVRVYQRVLGWEGVCATPGRCPAAPVLATAQSSLSSDENGELQITPLQLPGIAQTVEIAITTGSQGFLTLTLVKTP